MPTHSFRPPLLTPCRGVSNSSASVTTRGRFPNSFLHALPDCARVFKIFRTGAAIRRPTDLYSNFGSCLRGRTEASGSKILHTNPRSKKHKNPNRYLQTSSDAKSKLWLLGTRQQAPKFNEDYKRSAKRHGDNKPFLVRKAFLKRVLMEGYRHKL